MSFEKITPQFFLMKKCISLVMIFKYSLEWFHKGSHLQHIYDPWLDRTGQEVIKYRYFSDYAGDNGQFEIQLIGRARSLAFLGVASLRPE